MGGTVDFVEYDENWVKSFEIEKHILTDVFHDILIKVEHFGSTSVPGLSAKPIIDMFVFVCDNSDIDSYNDIMKSYGYEARGEQELTECMVFVKHKANSNTRTHKVNLCKENNEFSANALLFRDYLRIDKDAREKYQKLKKELARKYHDDPIAYGNGKRDCVAEILEEAKDYFG